MYYFKNNLVACTKTFSKKTCTLTHMAPHLGQNNTKGEGRYEFFGDNCVTIIIFLKMSRPNISITTIL